MSRFRLDAHLDFLLTRVLPEYAAFGPLAFAHVQGSLVLGYTDTSDLDVILVWDTPAVPIGREPLVARLDERQREYPEAIDYRDIHIDRFLVAGQEYELAHYALSRFEQLMESARTGSDVLGREIVNPQALAAAFRDAVFVCDPRGSGQRLQATLGDFPEHLKANTRRAVQNNRERTLADVRKRAARGDWFGFQSALVGAGRTALQALFAQREVYWTGDKWKRAAMVRYGFEPHIIAAYDHLWAMQSSPDARIAALERLIALALTDTTGGGPAATRGGRDGVG